MTAAYTDTAVGWTVVGAGEVPDGGDELVQLLVASRADADSDADVLAEALQLDEGLIRRGLEKLVARKPPTPLELATSLAKRRRADFIQLPDTSHLPAATVAMARELIVVAAGVAPVSMPRAKTITRLDGDRLEDIFDDLVNSGRLVFADGGEKAWVATN